MKGCTISILNFIHSLKFSDAPKEAQDWCKLSLLDLIGVAVAGTQTKLSRIIRAHAADEFCGSIPILFDNRKASTQGVALAAGMTIDSIDAHDGFNPAKGHIGCSLLPVILALSQENPIKGEEFLSTLLMGYEFGARASMAQHGTVPDYHTSGSWGAVTAAAAAARLLNLSIEETRHAIGIAEYHGPRSQMMRCIDHPTMLKDGSGWGAMTGVSAAKLAQKGFTGAPAITVEKAETYWGDFGTRWYMCEQYYKPYPVCRWAQAPIEAAQALAKAYCFEISEIKTIDVITFHEAVRLATNRPETTEEAQYSTSYPVAVALARGDVTPQDISDEALKDPDILRLSECLKMQESKKANSVFPNQRIAKVKIRLKNDIQYESDWTEPKWDPTDPPSPKNLHNKFYKLSNPILGQTRTNHIKDAVENLYKTSSVNLLRHLCSPI